MKYIYDSSNNTGKKIIFCLPGKQFSGDFLTCWTELLQHCFNKNHKIYLSQQYSSNVYFARALCVGANVNRGEIQHPFNGQIDYDFIMWIDSDIIFKPEQFDRLLNHDVDICSGLYFMEGGREFAAVEKWDTEFFLKNNCFEFLTPDILARKNPKGLMEVDYNGFGFMLIKKGVFENIKYPWFFDEMQKIGNCVDIPSEDVSFCKKAKKAGYKIYIDPSIVVGHQKTITL